MGNLLKNPGFEQGLLFWTAFGDVSVGTQPFTGTQAALFGDISSTSTGTGSLKQTVLVSSLTNQALLLGLTAYHSTNRSYGVTLTVSVEWLDGNSASLGLGLKMEMPRAFQNDGRLSLLGATARIPSTAVSARLTIEKLWEYDLLVDQVFLAPLLSDNLIRNPSFESVNEAWIWGPVTLPTTAFGAFEGDTAAVLRRISGIPDQTIEQFIESTDLAGGYFLLSFAFQYTSSISSIYPITVSVVWQDSKDVDIGTGLSLAFGRLPFETFTTCICVTNQAPETAVKARATFLNRGDKNGSDVVIDNVQFCRVRSSNLLVNGSFEGSEPSWYYTNSAIISTEFSLSLQGNRALAMESSAGVSSVFQDIQLAGLPGDSYLLSFGALANSPPGLLAAEVRWLDADDNELEVALSLTVSVNAPLNKWATYSGITGDVPIGGTKARILFTKEASGQANSLLIDNVIFTDLGSPEAFAGSIRGGWLR